jgi:hypothetical protein
MSNKPAPEEQILPLVMGFWQARALAVATERLRSYRRPSLMPDARQVDTKKGWR